MIKNKKYISLVYIFDLMLLAFSVIMIVIENSNKSVGLAALESSGRFVLYFVLLFISLLVLLLITMMTLYIRVRGRNKL